MSDDPNLASVPPSGLHHLQVKLAFLADPDHRAQPAVLITSTGADMLVRYIDDETTETITVTQPDRLATIVARDDLCRIGGPGSCSSTPTTGWSALPPGSPLPHHVSRSWWCRASRTEPWSSS